MEEWLSLSLPEMEVGKQLRRASSSLPAEEKCCREEGWLVAAFRWPMQLPEKTPGGVDGEEDCLLAVDR